MPTDMADPLHPFHKRYLDALALKEKQARLDKEGDDRQAEEKQVRICINFVFDFMFFVKKHNDFFELFHKR